MSLKFLPLIITFSWTPSSRESKSCGNAGQVLELETVVVGIRSGLVFNEGSGFQERVDGVGMGVQDEGFQAGVNEGAQSGMGVELPELEGAEG